MLFVFALFFTKNQSSFTNKANPYGLVYNGDEVVGDLVNRDTDKDGLLDWEEGLYGTDPTKKDTNDDGVPDNIEIAKMRGQNLENGELDLNIDGSENLTETDRLSRELFSTVATLNQAGTLDQNAVEKLSDSLVANLKNTEFEKLFLYSDLTIIRADSLQDVKNYEAEGKKIFNKYPYSNRKVLDVLDKFMIDENNVDESVLMELDPIVKQTNNIIEAMAKMKVPESLAFLHLDFLNELQKFSKNVSNIRLYDADVVLAISGISQYETNLNNLESAAKKLENAINKRLRQ